MYTIVSDSEVKGFKVRKATWEGFSLDLLMAPNAPMDAEFLPARVEKNGVEWWAFKKDHPHYRGLATLVEYDDELVIVLSTRFELDLVVPIRDLPQLKKIGSEFVGGRKLKELVLLKQSVAEEFNVRPNWSKREAEMLCALERVSAEQNAEAVKAAEANRVDERRAEEDRRARERAEREARRERIASRKKIVAFTMTGDRRIGIPVVADEWMVLRDGTFCILVSSYDEKTGKVDNSIESFSVVKKGGGNPSRKSIAVVSSENVKPIGAPSVMKELKTTVITVDGDLEEVIVADDVQQVKTLCWQGLNSGTLVMCPKVGDTSGRFSIFRLIEGKIETVTEVVRRK